VESRVQKQICYQELIRVDCALNHVRFRAAMHPTWCMAECGVKIKTQKDWRIMKKEDTGHGHVILLQRVAIEGFPCYMKK